MKSSLIIINRVSRIIDPFHRIGSFFTFTFRSGNPFFSPFWKTRDLTRRRFRNILPFRDPIWAESSLSLFQDRKILASRMVLNRSAIKRYIYIFILYRREKMIVKWSKELRKEINRDWICVRIELIGYLYIFVHEESNIFWNLVGIRSDLLEKYRSLPDYFV